MLNRILVPLDGSSLAEGILACVSRLLLREDAEVVLLQVLPPCPESAGETEKARHRELVAGARDYLARTGKVLAESGATARYELRNGVAAEQILAAAEELDPSLVAMSTHGRSGVSRWFRGSVAERVLRECPRPLLLANPSDDEHPAPRREILFRRILVPLDGSTSAAKILPLVRDFADLYGSEIVISHSPPARAAAMTYPEWETPIELPDPEVLVREYREKLTGAGYRARVRLGAGLPAADILDAVDEEDADLVAMTTHGRSGLSRFVFGSVAEKVLRNCSAPLLVLNTRS